MLVLSSLQNSQVYYCQDHVLVVDTLIVIENVAHLQVQISVDVSSYFTRFYVVVSLGFLMHI